MTLAKVEVINANLGENQEEVMLQLGREHEQLTTAWLKVHGQHLVAIEKVLWAKRNENERQQAELLERYPELLFMAIKK